eukprot:jgi/Tetstr1/421212/TSEL_001117.t1
MGIFGKTQVSADESAEAQERIPARSVKDILVGDYDYSFLCMVSGLSVEDEWRTIEHLMAPSPPAPLRLSSLRAVVACTVYLRVGGIITPPILVGIADQVVRVNIPFTKYYVDSGLLSVMGTSFTFLPIAQRAVAAQMTDTNDPRDFPTAFGSLLGVSMIGSFVEMGMSFIPPRYLRKIFPPWISGLTIFLIGASLIGSGVKAWGGGTFCADNPAFGCGVGESSLKYGAASFIGLGFFVMVMTIVLELFGSPFLRSCQVAIALLLGYLLAATTTDYNGDKYVTTTGIENAPAVTFLWVKSFPIGFYAPALLPVLIGFVGGLLGDSVSSFLAALAFSMPNTTFSQNNGVISLTRVASRMAGIGCAVWLIIYGIFGKVGAFFTSIPQPVLGGMTTFLFANIAVSGIKVICSRPLTRRIRFILAISLSFGLGVTIWPAWTSNMFDCAGIDNDGLSGLCEGAKLTVTTGTYPAAPLSWSKQVASLVRRLPEWFQTMHVIFSSIWYAVGCVSALILHGIIPGDVEAKEDETDEEKAKMVDAQ